MNSVLVWGPETYPDDYRYTREGTSMTPIDDINSQVPQYLAITKNTPDQYFDYLGRQWPWSQLPEEIRQQWNIEAVGGGIGVRPNGRTRNYAHLLVWKNGQLLIEEGTKAPPTSEKEVLRQVALAFLRRCDLASEHELDLWVSKHLKKVAAVPLLPTRKTMYYVLPSFASDIKVMARALNNPGILSYVEINETEGGISDAVLQHISRELDAVMPRLLKGPKQEDLNQATTLLTHVIPAYDRIFNVSQHPVVARKMAMLKTVMEV